MLCNRSSVTFLSSVQWDLQFISDNAYCIHVYLFISQNASFVTCDFNDNYCLTFCGFLEPSVAKPRGFWTLHKEACHFSVYFIEVVFFILLLFTWQHKLWIFLFYLNYGKHIYIIAPQSRTLKENSHFICKMTLFIVLLFLMCLFTLYKPCQNKVNE